MPTYDLRSPVVRQPPPPVLKVEAAYGRLYVSGPAHRIALQVKGAAENKEHGNVELSLTLESIRQLRKLTRLPHERFAQMLTPDVLAWAMAAGKIEKRLAELHNKIADGWRKELPWLDNERAGSSRREPFDHQRVMATVATEIDGCAFLCEVGTGKTRAAIEAVAEIFKNGMVDLVFIVAPKGVIKTWKNEIPRWAQDMTLTVLDGPMARRQGVVTALTLAQDFDHSQKLVILTNYEALYPMRTALAELCKARRVGFVLDEMHRIRNPNTKVAKSAMKISQWATWRLGMTGTPVLQGAQDVWSQWYFIDLGVTFGANFVQYKRDFFTEDPYARSIDPLDGTLDEIGIRLRRRGLRYRKVDCFDLPPQLWETVEVEMAPQQQRAYREMAEHLVARLEGHAILPATPYLNELGFEWEESELDEDPDKPERVATAANQLAMILRLTQITSGFVNDEHGALYRFQPNAKMDAAIEFIEEALVQTPTIVWARYHADVDEFMRRLAHHNPVQIDGRTGQKRSQRLPGMSLSDEAEDDFQSGRTRLLVGHPAAGGEGRNLQRAGVAVYYSQGYSLLHRMQSEGRNHRSGSEIHSRITYATFVCKDTVDEIVMAALEGKKSVAEVVVDLKRQLGVRTNEQPQA